MISLISIAIEKYSAQNCLNAVVNTELFAYSLKMSCNAYAVKQGEMDDNMVIVNLTMRNINTTYVCNVLSFIKFVRSLQYINHVSLATLV
jgi:hypothetical protein